MEESKLFKRLWRFNAVVIAAAGVFALISAFGVIGMLVYEFTGSRHNNEIVTVDSDTEVKESFRLGQIQHLNGSDAVLVPLYGNQSFRAMYSSGKKSHSIRNLLFSNIRTESNTWLLPTNNYLISQHITVGSSYNQYSPNNADRRNDVIAMLYHIAKNDTNGDSRVTRDDQLTVALSTPEGERYTEVISNVDQFLGYDLLDEEAIAVMFNKAGKGYIAYINLSDFSVKKEIALPDVVK